MNNPVNRPDSTPKNPSPPTKSQPGHVQPIGPAYPVRTDNAQIPVKKTK